MPDVMCSLETFVTDLTLWQGSLFSCRSIKTKGGRKKYEFLGTGAGQTDGVSGAETYEDGKEKGPGAGIATGAAVGAATGIGAAMFNGAYGAANVEAAGSMVGASSIGGKAAAVGRSASAGRAVSVGNNALAGKAA